MAEAAVTLKLTLKEIGIVRAALEEMVNHTDDELNALNPSLALSDTMRQLNNDADVARRILSVIR